MRRALGACALVLVAVVALAAPASAHAQLVDTVPSAGAVLDKAPSVAKVRFNEGVQVKADGLQLHDASGDRVDAGAVRRTDGGRQLELPLGSLRDGGYVLTWRVVSADGHPISGGVTWRIGQSSQVGDEEMSDDIRWIRSYVMGEESGALGTVCIYQASSPEKIREHAERAGLPVDEIVEVADTVIVREDPATAAA